MGVGVMPIATVQQPRPRTMRRTLYARRGLQAAASAICFLVGYSALQMLHAFGRDPYAVKALSSIPLFARLLASGFIAGILGPITGAVVPEPERRLRWIPRTLGIAITLFVAVSVGFP